MHTEATSLNGGQQFSDSIHAAVISKISVQNVV